MPDDGYNFPDSNCSGQMGKQPRSRKKFKYHPLFLTTMGIAKVTRNYQVTIPRDIRRVQGIEVGDTVLFAIEGGKVDFMKMNRDQIFADAAGSWKGKVKEGGVEYVRKVRAGWVTRRRRMGL